MRIEGMSWGRRAGLALFAMLSGSPAMAHHSFAMFDTTKCLSISGTVHEFSMQYPHSWLRLYVAKPNGPVETWSFEGTDPATLRVAGWATDALKVGNKVELVFNPLRDGRPGGRFQQVKLANGRVLSSAQFVPCPANPTPASIQ